MTQPIELETPSAPAEIYMARAGEVETIQCRPLFTGDVLEVSEARLVALLQHPCAMRRGTILNPRLLVAEVRPQNSAPPSAWTGHLRRMFLPELVDGENWAVEFDEIDFLESAEALAAPRVAVLSQAGVNLMMQRWINHQSRVVVPTSRVNEMIAGQFDEADLTGDAVADLVDASWAPGDALRRVDAWLDSRDVAPSRRIALHDPQRRSTVRAELRREVRAWCSTGSEALS